MKPTRPSKVAVALYFLKRPRFYADLLIRARVNLGNSLLPAPVGRSRAVAERWCGRQAVSAEAALEKLGISPGLLDDAELNAMLEVAKQQEAACPEPLAGGGGANLIYALCEGRQAMTALETGVAHGFSSLAILASVCKRDGRLYSIDMPHPFLRDTSLVGHVVPERFRPNWSLTRLPDRIGLKKILPRVRDLDFAHYDSDKSYEGRIFSYGLIWKHLRAGGVFVSDDIGDNTAFRDFCEELCIEPIVIYCEGAGMAGSRYVGILTKPEN